MIVSRINLNNKRDTASNGELSTECQLMLFHIPMIFTENGIENHIKKRSAVIYANGFPKYFRSESGQGIKYDLIGFRMSGTDRQYIESLGIKMNSPIEINDDFVLSGLMKSMSAHAMVKSMHHREFAELTMKLIFIALGEFANINAPDQYSEIPRYFELKAIRDAIYEDPAYKWSVEEICEDMGISRAYFHRLYQQAFGVTCGQDIIESRLIQASELLRSTELSINEISEICGYETDGYFIKQFKKHKGSTPVEYRRKIHAEYIHNERK